MRLLGFDLRFVDLVWRIHTGTTANYVVNGDHSAPLPVRSGIRQGCPLASLLFLLVLKMLGLALHQDPRLTGLSAPGSPGKTHLFPAFVDDSTLLLEKAEQIPHDLTIIRDLEIYLDSMSSRPRVS